MMKSKELIEQAKAETAMFERPSRSTSCLMMEMIGIQDDRIIELEKIEEKNERTIKNMGLAIALTKEWVEEKDLKIAELKKELKFFMRKP